MSPTLDRGRMSVCSPDWHPPEVQSRRQAFSLPCHDVLGGQGSLNMQNQENPRSPTMRDLVYEVESPWVVQYLRTAVQYTDFRLHFQAIFVPLHSPDMPMPCWPLWKTRQPQSSLKAAPKRGHWLSLKYFLNNLLVYTKISSRDFTQFLLEFLCFEVAVSSKDVHRGSHLKLRGQDNPKTQKCIQNMRKSPLQSICLFNIHFM